jgi:hypothetical protein
MGRWCRGPAEPGKTVVCMLVLLAGQAQATQLRGAHLELTRSEQASECPDEEALARAVQAQLITQPAATPASLRLAVSIDRDADGFLAHIEVTGRKHGVRTLHAEGPGCEALTDALAVTLAMILDERAREAEYKPPPRPQTRPSAPTAAASLAQPQPGVSGWFSSGGAAARHQQLAAELDGWFSLGGAATWGLPHGGSWAAIGEFGVWHPPWGATVGAFWSPTQSIEYGQGTVSVRVIGGLAAGCYGLIGMQSATTLSLCLDAALGSLRGRGADYDSNRQQSRLWGAVGGGPALQGKITRLTGWRLRAAVAAPLWHDLFSVEGLPNAAYESDPLVAWISVHLLATIW